MGFFHALIASDDAVVDSIIVGGVTAMVVLIVITVYAVIMDAHSWNPQSFATGAGTILGATGATKGLRDKLTPQGPSQ